MYFLSGWQYVFYFTRIDGYVFLVNQKYMFGYNICDFWRYHHTWYLTWCFSQFKCIELLVL